MILTGLQIRHAQEEGDLVIEPFNVVNLNPNSYNYHLGSQVLEVTSGPEGQNAPMELPQSDAGFLLLPGRLYLASTQEFIGSRRYVITLLGRSSIGRLGLFLNVTADLGHSGSLSQWTLELKVVQPLRVYAGMAVGQVAFWVQAGLGEQYKGRYRFDSGPVPNRDRHLDGVPHNDSPEEL